MTFRKAVEASVVIERLERELTTLQGYIMSQQTSNTAEFRLKAQEAWDKLAEHEKFTLIKINEE